MKIYLLTKSATKRLETKTICIYKIKTYFDFLAVSAKLKTETNNLWEN